MRIRTCTLLLLLGLSMPALAELTTLVRAIEASASNLNVPTTPNGRLMFKPCSGECDLEYMTVQLTPATQYKVNRASTDFLEFRKAFFDRPRDKDTYALVRFETESNTATSVEIAN